MFYLIRSFFIHKIYYSPGRGFSYQRMSDAQMQNNNHLEKGKAYYDQGEYKIAIKEFEKALKESQDYIAAIFLGKAHGKLGEHKKSIDCYQKAMDIDATQPDAWVLMGGSYYYLGKYKEAIECYHKRWKYTNRISN